MKKTLLLLVFTIVVITGFAYRTAFFYQDFSSFPIGAAVGKVLQNDDDGTHGSNDACGMGSLKDYTDRRFHIEYRKPPTIVEWQFGKALKADTAKTGPVSFEARDIPVTEDRDFELELRFFIDWEYQVDPHWTLFRNYDPTSPKRDFDRLSVTYEKGILTLSAAHPGQTDFEVLYTQKINLSNAWHTFLAKKSENQFRLILDNGELYTYEYSRTPAWPVARVELYKGSFNFALIALFNGR